jgi:hypothetical protein
MLFSDMRCFTCGNPPEKGDKDRTVKLTSFNSRSGLLKSRPYEIYGIEICDSCLLEGGRQGRVCRSVTEQRPPNTYEYTWNPDGDDQPYRLPPPVVTRLLSEEKK